MASGTDPQKFQALVVLAQIDPARTLELLESHGAGKPELPWTTFAARWPPRWRARARTKP